MTVQSTHIIPPPEQMPDFEALAIKAANERVENEWFKIPANRITHGFSDPENDEGPDRYLLWDNERPPYQVDVAAFEAQGRPISNGEYATYLIQTHKDIPINWIWKTSRALVEENRDAPTLDSFCEVVCIKTVYGPIPLTLGLDWPVMASYNELLSYAEWAGYRIPTFHEVRSIYDLVDKNKSASKYGRASTTASTPNPEEIFVDLSECNVGLQHFHPMPITQNGNRLSGLGDMGGAWEWTSTLLEPYEGFKPMDIYPGYTGIPRPAITLVFYLICFS